MTHVIANSMGGAIALALAENSPEKITEDQIDAY